MSIFYYCCSSVPFLRKIIWMGVINIVGCRTGMTNVIGCRSLLRSAVILSGWARSIVASCIMLQMPLWVPDYCPTSITKVTLASTMSTNGELRVSGSFAIHSSILNSSYGTLRTSLCDSSCWIKAVQQNKVKNWNKTKVAMPHVLALMSWEIWAQQRLNNVAFSFCGDFFKFFLIYAA